MRRRAGIEKELASRADQRVLRWFGHVERMDEYRMAIKSKCNIAEVTEADFIKTNNDYTTPLLLNFKETVFVGNYIFIKNCYGNRNNV